jgi:group I intron endonuclease
MVINGVYKITNIVNGKIYIGSSASKRGIIDRWYSHKTRLKQNKHTNDHLQKAYNYYSANNFIYEIIEECAPENCLIREQYYLDLFKSYDPNIGYNLCKTAGNTLGQKHSQETRQKIGQNRIYGPSPLKNKKRDSDFSKKVSLGQKGSLRNKTRMQEFNKQKRIPVIGVHIKTGEIIKLTHAGADSRFINSGIQQCCVGKTNSYKGYKWSYDSRSITS